MQTSDYLFLFLFLIIGAISLLAAVLDLNWFFNTRQASGFVNWMGRSGARLFYGLLGAALIAGGIAGLLVWN